MSSSSNNSSSSSSTPRYFRLITIALLFTSLLFIIIQFIGKQGKLQPVSPSSKTQQISTDTKNQQQPSAQKDDDESKCLTFDERYNFCINLKKSKPNPLDRKQYLEEHFLFSSSSTRQQHQKEVALLRMHRRKNWREEFWLSVCTFIVEASEKGKRDAFLYTIDGHEDSIPIEFQSFVKIHPETELYKTFSEENATKYNVLKYTGGYHRGDLAAAVFLKQHPHQYDFAWVIESDVRFVGSSWKYLFDTSRRVARDEPDVLDENDEKSSSFISSKGKDAHFIFYSPRVLFFGYDIAEALRPIIFPKIINKNRNITLFNVNAVLNFLAHAYQEVRDGKPIPENPSKETILNYDAITEREKFHGKNFSTALENRVWYQAFAPAFGMSRTLAKKIYENALDGEGWGNQEIDLPVTAILNNLKSVSLAPQFQDNTISTQFYFSWQRKAPLMLEKWFRKSEKDGESAPLYTSWLALRDGEMKNDDDNDENRGSSSSTNNPAKAIVTPKMLDELKENGFPEAVCRYWSFGVSPRFKGKKCLRNVLFHPVKY